MKDHRRFLTGLVAGCLAGLLVGGGALSIGRVGGGDDGDRGSYRARAKIVGPPGSRIRGEALFVQKASDKDQPTPPVRVRVRVKNLPTAPSASPERGFHVHERGACEPSFLAAGGHHDYGATTPPTISRDTRPDNNHPYHLGDLPNLQVSRKGVGHLSAVTSRLVLQPNHPLSIFDGDGAAVIVHLNRDNGDQGPPGREGPPGSAGGPRTACGVIVPEEKPKDR